MIQRPEVAPATLVASNLDQAKPRPLRWLLLGVIGKKTSRIDPFFWGVLNFFQPCLVYFWNHALLIGHIKMVPWNPYVPFSSGYNSSCSESAGGNVGGGAGGNNSRRGSFSSASFDCKNKDKKADPSQQLKNRSLARSSSIVDQVIVEWGLRRGMGDVTGWITPNKEYLILTESSHGLQKLIHCCGCRQSCQFQTVT